MEVTSLFLFFAIFVHFDTVNSQQDLNCVPLRQCPALLYLVRHRDNLPNMSRVDVYRYLRDLHCGFSGSDPLIKCLNDEEGKIIYSF